MFKKIALNGPLASGKTVLSEKLQSRKGFKIITIGIPIKHVSSLLVTDHEKLENYLLNRFGNEKDATIVMRELVDIQHQSFQQAVFETDRTGQHIKTENYRLLTQKVATKVRELYGKGIWVKFLAQDAEELIKSGEKVICDDMRVKEEKQYFEEYGFTTIRLNVSREEQKRRAKKRGDGDISDAILDDPTEHDLDFEPFHMVFDTTSYNEEEVYHYVVNFIEEEGVAK